MSVVLGARPGVSRALSRWCAIWSVVVCVLYLRIPRAQAIGPEDHEVMYVRAGSNATLPCHPFRKHDKNSVVPQVAWYKEDEKLVWDDRVLQPHQSRMQLRKTNRDLEIRQVATEDDGEYHCVLTSGTRQRGSVKLLVQDVPDPPGMPLVGSFSSRSVDLSWTSSRNVHNSPILHYIIHIRVGETGEWDSRNKVMTTDNSTRFQVIGLQPFTVYSFRVLAVNAIGASKPSKESYYMITLREVPEGKPHVISANNVSSNSIRIQWTPPPKNTIHGEFEGYRITYRPKERPETDAKEVIIRNNQEMTYTIRNLETYTEYVIDIQVFNPAGRGPSVIFNVMTDEGMPSAPINLTVDRITEATVHLVWREPLQPNAKLAGYYVYYSEVKMVNSSHKKTVRHAKPIMEYTLAGLKPYTHYNIWVKAYTSRDVVGNPSGTVEVRTDVKGPSAPRIVNITCSQTLDSVYVSWERPATYYHQVDYYYVHYRAEDSWSFEEIAMAAENRIDHNMFIPNLTANTLYEVKVQGATRSLIDPKSVYRGQFSQSRKVLLQSKCESYDDGEYGEYAAGFSAALIAGIVCISFVLIIALLSFFLWKKYFQAAYYYLDDPPGNRASPQLSETFDDSEYRSIHVSQWAKHVSDLHADGDIGFSREYETLQQSYDLDLTSDYSQLEDNRSKNRYVNIVAYDHTRVILKPVPGQKKSPDYINANFIDGYNKSRAYIGTQGPMPSTFDDYWRMIWEHRVHVIIMITNLIERSRRKCDMYWPKEGSESYGIIQVKMNSEVPLATYTIRTFTIKNLKIKKKGANERVVVQYHYTNWPDHGVPDHSLPVLAFVRKSAAANPPGAGPMIVHCSAGVGRTGTYIVLDAMLRQMKHKYSLNVFGFLKHIRRQRNYLVQTEEQYIFVHDALLEAIESGGDTEVPLGQLSRYVQALEQPQLLETKESPSSPNCEPPLQLNNKLPPQPTPPLTWTLLERQYKLVTVFKAKDFNVVSAVKPCNKAKNRSLNLLPIESHRVHISAKPGQDGSDYINATFIQGYSQLREYIATQHPLMDTIGDFWRMIWDHNVQTVVCLSQIDEKEYPQFWPDRDEELDYGTFKVRQCGASTSQSGHLDQLGTVTSRDFILQSSQDDYEFRARLFHCPGWPDAVARPALFRAFDLIRVVHTWHTQSGGASLAGAGTGTSSGSGTGGSVADAGGNQVTGTSLASGLIGGPDGTPVVVVDRFGGTEAATYCCLSALRQQMEREQAIDVYLYAKLYHMRRPGIWRTQEDYMLLYRACESLYATMLPQTPEVALPSQIIGTANNNGHHATLALQQGGQVIYTNGQAVKIMEESGVPQVVTHLPPKIQSPD